jgi:hypothetical protein
MTAAQGSRHRPYVAAASVSQDHNAVVARVHDTDRRMFPNSVRPTGVSLRILVALWDPVQI